jgi:hypothetical protein
MDTVQGQARRRPLGGLVQDIFSDAEALVRDHVDLARAEVRSTLARAKHASGVLVGAAVTVGLGVLFLALAAAFAVAEWIGRTWAGFLFVAVVLLVAGATLYAISRSRLKQVEPQLPHTKRALKEDKAWVSTTLKSR